MILKILEKYFSEKNRKKISFRKSKNFQPKIGWNFFDFRKDIFFEMKKDFFKFFKIIFLHDEKIFFDKIFFRELEFVSTFDFCGF